MKRATYMAMKPALLRTLWHVFSPTQPLAAYKSTTKYSSPSKGGWSNPTRHFHNNGFLYACSLPEIMGFIKSNSSMILVKNQFTFCISVQ